MHSFCVVAVCTVCMLTLLSRWRGILEFLTLSGCKEQNFVLQQGTIQVLDWPCYWKQHPEETSSLNL